MSEKKVSIICYTYNHEKYIRDTLEGFVNQKTDFEFIAYIHDDASTDNTAEIIKKYERKYPNLIKGIYQTENQYSKNIDTDIKYISPLVDSKYIAYCEGDDYWIDPLKLQKQVNSLERNIDCELCVHKVYEVDFDGNKNGYTYPNFNIRAGVIKSYDFLKMCKSYSFHTSSYMMRTGSWKKYVLTPPPFKHIASVGDEIMLLYYGQLGNVYYIDEIMSCYRRGVAGSWSERIGNAANTNIYISHLNDMIKVISEFDKYTIYKYHDLCLNRISNYMFKKCILSKDFYNFVNNKEVFNCLSKSKKLFILLGVVFPQLITLIYFKRINHLNKAHSR